MVVLDPTGAMPKDEVTLAVNLAMIGEKRQPALLPDPRAAYDARPKAFGRVVRKSNYFPVESLYFCLPRRSAVYGVSASQILSPFVSPPPRLWAQ